MTIPDWANAAAGALVLAAANSHYVPMDLWGGALPHERGEAQGGKGDDPEILAAIKYQGYWWPGESPSDYGDHHTKSGG